MAEAAQRSVFAALGWMPPRFHYVPLLCDERGEKLSKREASAGLDPLRQAGLDSAVVIGRLAAGLNLVEPETRISANELLQHLTQKGLCAFDS